MLFAKFPYIRRNTHALSTNRGEYANEAANMSSISSVG
jgi:hypothetical protein